MQHYIIEARERITGTMKTEVILFDCKACDDYDARVAFRRIYPDSNSHPIVDVVEV